MLGWYYAAMNLQVFFEAGQVRKQWRDSVKGETKQARSQAKG